MDGLNWITVFTHRLGENWPGNMNVDDILYAVRPPVKGFPLSVILTEKR